MNKAPIFKYANHHSDTKSDKTPNGKLRLLYECAPLSFIAAQAGGKVWILVLSHHPSVNL